jgi:hypothetical protein
MPSYILRDIPADLWRQVKVEAATEGVSVREVILRGLKEYAVAARLRAPLDPDYWDALTKKDKKERTR